MAFIVLSGLILFVAGLSLIPGFIRGAQPTALENKLKTQQLEHDLDMVPSGGHENCQLCRVPLSRGSGSNHRTINLPLPEVSYRPAGVPEWASRKVVETDHHTNFDRVQYNWVDRETSKVMWMNAYEPNDKFRMEVERVLTKQAPPIPTKTIRR